MQTTVNSPTCTSCACLRQGASSVRSQATVQVPDIVEIENGFDVESLASSLGIPPTISFFITVRVETLQTFLSMKFGIRGE